MASWYLPYEYTSVPIEAGNVNPFGVDPEQTMSILTGNTDPFGIDPEQTVVLSGVAGTGMQSKRELEDVPAHRLLENLTSYRLLEQSSGGSGSNMDPFDIDPEQTTLITVGLTSSD